MRQPAATGTDPAAPGPARGVLRPAAPTEGRFEHSRIPPDPALGDFIEHYWLVRWELGGETQTRETLPHPNVQLIFERGAGAGEDEAHGRIAGVHSGRFTRHLTGSGHVFGVKFRAGAFPAFSGQPVSGLRDRVCRVGEVLPFSVEALAAGFARGTAIDALVEMANRLLLDRRPVATSQLKLAAELVDAARTSPDILTVRALAGVAGMNVRSLERLFASHVGIGPKWVIRRYRLQELVERANGGAPLDWAQTAAELGYADQAHLITDFRAAVGTTPEAYRARPPLPPTGEPICD